MQGQGGNCAHSWNGYKVKETGFKTRISKACKYAGGYGTEVSDDTVLCGEQIMKETSPPVSETHWSGQRAHVACSSLPGHKPHDLQGQGPFFSFFQANDSCVVSTETR